jgi:hypothetical protein
MTIRNVWRFGTMVIAGSALMVQTFAARPFVVDDAGTVEPGKFEFELAADYWQDKLSPSTVFKHGVTERMDIGICLGYCQAPYHEQGISAAGLGLKFALVPDLLTASFGAEFGSANYTTLALLTKQVGPVELDANLGFEATVDHQNDVDLRYGVAAVVPIKRFAFGAEFMGTQEIFDWWQVGGRFSITEWFTIDCGLGGDFQADVDWNISTGIWIGFPITRSSVQPGI